MSDPDHLPAVGAYCSPHCARPYERRLELGARVLAALTWSAEAREVAFRLELDCLVDPRQRAVLAAVRALQAAGEPIGVIEIDDWLAAQDAARGSNLAALAGAAYVGLLVADAAPYAEPDAFGREAAGQVARDVEELRCARNAETTQVGVEETWYGRSAR